MSMVGPYARLRIIAALIVLFVALIAIVYRAFST